jgi:hypothetical protein
MAREPLIIRARVRAWLLGIPLLTLEAKIRAEPESPPVLAAAQPVHAQAQAQAPEPGRAVARARKLIEQGARELESDRPR